MKRYLFGASGHARVVVQAMTAAGIELNGVWDHNTALKSFGSFTVQHDLSATVLMESDQFHVGIGSNQNRKNVVELLHTDFYSVIHPTAILGIDLEDIGKGTSILAGSVVNIGSKIGKHCIINTSAVVDHDCLLEDFVHVSPNATLTGGVRVGEGSQIGAGASVLPGVQIGRWVMIGAGAVILKDVPDYAVVVGNPGRIIKFNQ